MNGPLEFGGELLVNASTASDQHSAAGAALRNGGYVWSWVDENDAADGSGSAIKIKFYTSANTPNGGETVANTDLSGSQVSPAIAVLNSGSVILVWQDPGSQSDIKARLFSTTGAASGAEFSVNSVLQGNQSAPVVAALAGGGFVVVWEDQGGPAGDGSGSALVSQLFDASGTKSGAPFVVNTSVLGNQFSPTVAALVDGGFAVSWVDSSGLGGDSSATSIKAQLFNGLGGRSGNEILVNTSILNTQFEPSIAAVSGGGFAVAWTDSSGVGSDASGFAVKLRRFDAAGAALGAEILVNTTTSLDQFAPSLQTLANGQLAVIWQDGFAGGADSEGYSIKGQLFAAGGSRLGLEFLVNTMTVDDQSAPAAVALLDGGFIVAWQDASTLGGDSSGLSIKAQHFIAPALAMDDAYVLISGQQLSIGSDDGVGTNEISASFSLLQAPAHGFFQFAADGGFQYSPPVGYHGIDSFIYQAVDGDGHGATSTASLYVVPVNVGPTTTLALTALTPEQQIAAIYIAFFGRGADAAGFAFWVNEFVTKPGNVFVGIASSFGISAEAKAMYPFLVEPFGASDQQIGSFLDSVYANLFNRSTDDAGRAYWAGEIHKSFAAGTFVGSVLVNIIGGAQNTLDGQDITTLMNKVAVNLAFVEFQQEHAVPWHGASDVLAASQLLDPVGSDTETVLIGIAQANQIVQFHEY